MHLTEDDLILHYYGEAGDTAETGVQTHLDACDECRGAFQALRRVMEAIDTAPVPEPGPAFERTVWARLAPQLDNREKSAGKNFGWFNFRGLVFAGGLAALVCAVIAWQFDINFTRTAPGVESTQASDASAHREKVLLTAVSDHIEQSELVLVELANAEAGSGALDVSLERDTADELVSAGRLYRETARQNGDLQLASLLDDLEMVLVEIARGPQALSPKQLDDLRAQIDDQELIFKLRVLAAEVKARQQNARPQPGSSKRTL
jgi:hypothetical protein